MKKSLLNITSSNQQPVFEKTALIRSFEMEQYTFYSSKDFIACLIIIFNHVNT